MSWLYDRAETDEEIVIRYKRAPVLQGLSLLLFGCMIGSVVGRQFPLALLFCAVGFALSMSYRNANAEVKRAMRSARVTVSGSKWSFANPLTIRIPKGKVEGIQPGVGR